MSSSSSRNLVARGQYGSSPLGTSIFVGLRILDGFVLQRALQVLDPLPALLAKVGISVPPPPPTGGASLSMSAHALTPFQAVIWGMNIACALKQIVWAVFISREQMSPQVATILGVSNAIFSSVGTLAFSYASVNPTWSGQALKLSVASFAVGILIELWAELQRKWFKDDPKNAGKPYSGGLFGIARSVNYFGYTIWRGSMSVAGAGWAYGAAITAVLSYDFCTRAIPSMDEYCTKRYGAQWVELKRKVPYAFFPWVY